jgi:hypothetical protein
MSSSNPTLRGQADKAIYDSLKSPSSRFKSKSSYRRYITENTPKEAPITEVTL